MDSNKVKTKIFGNTYNIQGDAMPEYIQELAGYVDKKMTEVSRAMSSSDALQVAILTALNIADEYFQLRNIDNSVTLDIEKKTNALISMLEEGLIGDVLTNKFTMNQEYNNSFNR